MIEPRTNRRLAAILAADVAGYSRLMGADEEGTLARLTGHRRELFDPAITKHRGRIVKTTGDGLLAEFSSVVDAVRCAAEVQAGMAERNAASGTPRLEFRIGINVGDIVMQDDDIFGDGVNIAARLESIADPGGICVSERVQEDAAGRTGMTFEDMGEQSLKNIARPVRAYRVRIDLSDSTGAALPQVPHRPLVLPDKPSIAVLPFQNMSDDPEQEYFADGVVEDIITSLSRFRSFAVIARNSSFVYKGRAVDVRQVARDLGVRYILEGSVRRAGQRLRITAQLVEATSGAHLWADRFEGAVDDVFNVQDRITESVVGVIEPQIRRAEIERARRKRPENLTAYDHYLRGLAMLYTANEPDNAEAYRLLMQALELEPNYAPLIATATQALESRIAMGWPGLTTDDQSACLDLARRALAVAQGDPNVLAQCGITLIRFGADYDRGLRLLRNAVEANPNNQFVLLLAGIGELHCGSIDKAIAHSNRAILLSPPGDMVLPVLITTLAHADMVRGEYEQAIADGERSLALNAALPFTYWMLIAANAHLGRMEDAHRWLAKFRDIAPGMTIARINAAQPGKDPSRMAAILEGLRLAGLDEG